MCPDVPAAPARTWLLAWVLACDGGGAGDGGDDAAPAEGSSTGATSDAGPTPDEQVPSALCEEAPRAVQGRFSGTLRGEEVQTPTTEGVCGAGGPERFLRLMVPARADLRVEARGLGFVPRVSLTPAGCLGAPRLVCSADGSAGLSDVAEGTELTLTIGADPDEFAAMAAAAAPEDGPDPLGFVVDVGLVPVLKAGDVCMPQVLGRCAGGTLCMATAAEDEAWRCTELGGDRCADPERVTLKLVDGAGTLTIDPNLPQSDAHRHSCTGGGTRERVLQVHIASDMRPQDSLRIHSLRPEVGLAVRAPGCLGTDESACGAPRVGGAQVTIAEPRALQAAGVSPYLFVELPEPGVLAESVELEVRVVLRSPPTGTP